MSKGSLLFCNCTKFKNCLAWINMSKGYKTYCFRFRQIITYTVYTPLHLNKKGTNILLNYEAYPRKLFHNYYYKLLTKLQNLSKGCQDILGYAATFPRNSESIDSL